MLVVCSLDPFAAQSGTTVLDMRAPGLGWADQFTVVDELSGAEYAWGQFNYVELGPHRKVAHILRIMGDSTAPSGTGPSHT